MLPCINKLAGWPIHRYPCNQGRPGAAAVISRPLVYFPPTGPPQLLRKHPFLPVREWHRDCCEMWQEVTVTGKWTGAIADLRYLDAASVRIPAGFLSDFRVCTEDSQPLGNIDGVL